MARVLTVVTCPFSEPEWIDRVDLFDRTRLSPGSFLRMILARSRDYDAVILNGAVGLDGRYADLVAAGLLGRRSPAPGVVIADATWEVGSARLSRLVGSRGMAFSSIAKAVVRWIDGPHVTYCVLSSAERATFPKIWNVDQGRVVFTPYGCTRDRLSEAAPTGDFAFAGGDSLRDYPMLIEAIRGTDISLRMATSESLGGLPVNASASSVSHDQFMDLLWTAGVVVVPLRADTARSAGQQTYINAMAWGKLVIATDAPGVRDHIDHERTGIIVPPRDALRLREVLLWAFDARNRAAVDLIRAAARETAQAKFAPNDYAQALFSSAQQTITRIEKGNANGSRIAGHRS